MADTTPHRNYPQPHPANKLEVDVLALRAFAEAVDLDMGEAIRLLGARPTTAQVAQTIADAVGPKANWTDVNQLMGNKANASDLTAKANKATTLEGYGITDGVSKSGAQFGPADVMAGAPLGQWSQFGTVGVAPAADWPTTASVAWWNVLTIGTNDRRTQRASQVFSGDQQGWVFERQLHDATWSRWRRVFNDGSLIEASKHYPVGQSVYNVNPANETVVSIDVYSAITVNVAAPRGLGDQLTMLFSMTAAYPITFSANVKPPDGGMPTFAANRFRTVALTARPDGNWNLHIGGANPW